MWLGGRFCADGDHPLLREEMHTSPVGTGLELGAVGVGERSSWEIPGYPGGGVGSLPCCSPQAQSPRSQAMPMGGGGRTLFHRELTSTPSSRETSQAPRFSAEF